MPDYDEKTYGERIADVYDELATPASSAEDAAEFLASVAGNRRVLELGIGTGRVAIPLAARGVKVYGIDASPKMVEKMRAKPGGDAIRVEFGNFADVKIGGKFSLIFVVFNTLFMLEDQATQLRCFAQVAKHLTPDGAFVIEAFVPDHSLFDRGQRLAVSHIGDDFVKLDASIHDRAAQTTNSAHVVVGESGTRVYPIKIRYAFPAELDLMARMAGMRLRDRWGGWRREPFGASSEHHVSVYELASRPDPARKLAKPRPSKPKRAK
ncbi:MAG TPA: class I SAM-dependent methyltransferase [Candidatus Acidoferrales bacterium]|nr:class I SAM-dependent methyltransferase [Candidatus Acidoferrales bacterium]